MSGNQGENPADPSIKYEHNKLEGRRKFLRYLLRTIGFRYLARVDRVEGQENVPAQGPAILLINHIAYVDPIVVLHVLPRNIVPMAKIEVYNMPVVGIFPRLWGVIPVKRGEFDRRAVRHALAVLAAGEIVLIAPEGTRSSQLQAAKEGIAYLALRSQAPIIPAALDGTEGFPCLPLNRRWREPGAHVRFGRGFHLKNNTDLTNRERLSEMTDQAMTALARLLPEHRRGKYAEKVERELNLIEWLD